ncbi:uncharacterized protein LOC133895922 [Phragmites australis]|uniref:uncharacterized protein LOC133895922 n=1 Tax=Phragmites australis TaxID=29695 RepID=UPI002D79F12B|nr:uncharacterized protein LOC133895922 [Phragmites australis]
MSTSHPGDWVLLNIHAYLGKRRNATTASATTRDHQTIEGPPPFSPASSARRKISSFSVSPSIVNPTTSPRQKTPDYFIYRAHTKREPSLQRLSRPHPFFHDDDVGLLSRGHHYTIAALIATPTLNVFHLHRFHSEIGTWTYTKVSVGEPQQSGFPSLLIPNNCSRLLHHDTSTVMAIGGEGGTMGWVDLWRGILFCDLLRDEPTLRAVPLPLPLDLVSCNNGLGVQLGCPNSRRAIAFIKKGGSNTEDCLKLVHLEANATRHSPP